LINIYLLFNLIKSFVNFKRFTDAMKLAFMGKGFYFSNPFELFISYFFPSFFGADKRLKPGHSYCHTGMKSRIKFPGKENIPLLIGLLTFFSMIMPAKTFATVTITKPTLTIGTCSGIFPTAYQTLGNIVITEVNNADFAIGTNVTIVIDAPANYEFNPGTGTVSFKASSNITGASIVVTATTITITYTVTGTNRNDVMTISGIQVRATSSSGSSQTITRTGGTGTIAGLVAGTSVGTLSQNSTPPAAPTGSGQSLCGSGSVLISANPPAGSTINWYSSASGGSPIGTGSFFNTPSISSTTTYYAESVSGDCNSTTRTPVVATILTAATADAGANVTVCQSTSSQTISLSDASIGGGASTGTWTRTGTGSFTPGGSTSGPTGNPQGVSFTIPANATGTITLTLTTDDPGGTGDACGPDVDTKTITISGPPTVGTNTITGTSQSGCGITFFGSDPTTPTCTNPQYQWYQAVDNASDNGVYTIIPGATGQNYSPTSGQKNNWFKRVVTCGSCSNVSFETNHIHWKTDIAGAINVNGSSTATVCEGTSATVTFTSNNGTPPITYTYNINGGADQR
jgi:hypothetical protein